MTKGKAKGPFVPFLASDFVGALVDSDEFADVVFTFSGSSEKVFGHSFVFSTASPVFASMFAPDPALGLTPAEQKEGKVEVAIKGASPQMFRMIKRMLYVDDLDVVTGSNVLDIIKVAKRYQIDKVRWQICERRTHSDVCFPLYEAA